MDIWEEVRTEWVLSLFLLLLKIQKSTDLLTFLSYSEKPPRSKMCVIKMQLKTG